MPALIPGDSSQYPTEIQTPVDGDTANAASVSTGLAQLADRTANLNARLVSGGGGGGAPTDAEYLLAASDPALTEATVVPAQGLTFLAATDAAGQRAAMSLGGSAILNVGTTAGTVAAGDDSRITGAAQKSANLSDLANAATARTNLGLATVASSGAYSDLSGKPTLGSAAAASTSDFDAAGAASAAQAASLPLHGTADDSVKVGGTTPSTFGKSLIDDTDAAAARSTLGLGDSAPKDVGTTAGTVAAGDDSRFTDARAPTAHATTHKSGGTDAIKLDELAAPTDVTTLNASTSAHGLLRKLDGDTTHFLNGNGAWTTPAGSVPVDAAGGVGNVLTNGFTTLPGILSYTSGTGLGTGTLRARPVVFGRSGTLTQLGIVVNTGVANAKVRVGLYESDANGGPGALLVDSGELDCSTNGRKLVTGLSIPISASKVYWFAALGGTASANLAVISTAVYMNAMVAASVATGGSVCLSISVAQSYGTLPSTFPAGYAAVTSVTGIPIPLFTVTP